MESKKAGDMKVLQIDTDGQCFMCINPIQPRPSTSRAKNMGFDFTSIIKLPNYLGIDLKKIFLGVTNITPLEKSRGLGECLSKNTDLQVSLCDECKRLVNDIWPLLERLEIIQNMIGSRLQEVSSRMQNKSEIETDFLKKMAATPERLLITPFIQKLREELKLAIPIWSEAGQVSSQQGHQNENGGTQSSFLMRLNKTLKAKDIASKNNSGVSPPQTTAKSSTTTETTATLRKQRSSCTEEVVLTDSEDECTVVGEVVYVRSSSAPSAKRIPTKNHTATTATTSNQPMARSLTKNRNMSEELNFINDIIGIGVQGTSNEQQQQQNNSTQHSTAVSQKMHKCEDPACTRTFKSKSNAHKHYRIRHLNIRFPCPWCGRNAQYSQKELNNHMLGCKKRPDLPERQPAESNVGTSCELNNQTRFCFRNLPDIAITAYEYDHSYQSFLHGRSESSSSATTDDAAFDTPTDVLQVIHTDYDSQEEEEEDPFY